MVFILAKDLTGINNFFVNGGGLKYTDYSFAGLGHIVAVL